MRKMLIIIVIILTVSVILIFDKEPEKLLILQSLDVASYDVPTPEKVQSNKKNITNQGKCRNIFLTKEELRNVNFKDLAESEEISLYLQKLGYLGLSNYPNKNVSVTAEYENFSNQDLIQLADANDAKALLTLVLRFQIAADYEKVHKFAYKAVLLGYTSPFNALASSSMAQSMNARKSKNTERAVEHYLEGAAWQNMADYRYDPMHLLYSDLANYAEIYKKDLKIEDLERKVEYETKRLYEKILEDRNQLGLGEFEDNIPIVFLKKDCSI